MTLNAFVLTVKTQKSKLIGCLKHTK